MTLAQTPMDRPLRVLQISDTHLCADPTQQLMGVNPERCLEAVLELLQTDTTPADLLLVTGDLVHDGSAAGYQRLGARLSSLGIPAYCLPGNHDDGEQMRQSLNLGNVHTVPATQHGAWAFMFLDSTQAGEVGGHLDEKELEQLEQNLEQQADRHCLVCLHHHPVPVGSPWMDAMALDNPEALFAVLERHPQVRGVVWGHVHQVYDATRNGIRLLGCPSTNAQFLPGAERFDLDPRTPGYRWLDLHADGRIDTGVGRLEGYPARVDGLGSDV